MPLVGFRCPDTVPTAGRDNDHSFCINECPHRCLPTAVLATIWHNTYHNEHKGDMISPSALGNCPRSFVLERTKPYYQEPTKLYHTVRGSLIHGFLENAHIDGTLKEQRIYKPIDDWWISGRFDFLDLRKGPTLEDYKTTQDKTTWFLFNEGAKTEHILQTNVYRWLLNGGHLGAKDGPVVNYDIDRIVIHYLFMGRIISTGTTIVERVTAYDKPRKPYGLQIKEEQIGFNKWGKPLFELTIQLPDVPIMSEEEVVAHIMTYGPELIDAFDMDPADIRHVLDDSDQRWRCDFCGVRQQCLDIEATRNQPALFDLKKPLQLSQENYDY